MLDVKKLLIKLTRRSVHIGSQIDLGTITVNSQGYYGFSLGTSCPNGCTVISFLVYWGNATGAFSIPAYSNGTTRTHYVCGTPNATITGLKIIPVYVIE